MAENASVTFIKFRLQMTFLRFQSGGGGGGGELQTSLVSPFGVKSQVQSGSLFVSQFTSIFGELVSWCFKPSQPQRITSGLTIFGEDGEKSNQAE